MLPIVACSVISLAIIIERSLVLRRRVVMPEGLVADIDRALGRGSLTPDRIALLRRSSPLGRVSGRRSCKRPKSSRANK